MIDIDEYTDVVYYLNDVNEDLYLNGIKHINIHNEVRFGDYPFIIKYGRWIIKNTDLNMFNDMIQDKIMENKYHQDDTKDEICFILQQRKNKYHPIY